MGVPSLFLSFLRSRLSKLALLQMLAAHALLPFVSGEHPLGSDCGRAEEAADDCGPSIHQQHEALLHRQVQRLRPGGDEVQHQGSALVRHPRWRRTDGGAQDQVKS